MSHYVKNSYGLKDQNVILIGMRGSGKSTVGGLLAERLGRRFIDTDELIVQKTGQSIRDMVRLQGWDYFRDQESAVAEDVSKLSNIVIATGGGIILRPENTRALKTNGKLILLAAKPSVLAARIGHDPNRPQLISSSNIEAELEALWRQRQKTYQQAADISVWTDNYTTEEVTRKVLGELSDKYKNLRPSGV